MPGTTAAPARPSRWLLGEGSLIEVWEAHGDPTVMASLLMRNGRALMIMNASVVGSADEARVIRWAMTTLAEHDGGFYYLLDDSAS